MKLFIKLVIIFHLFIIFPTSEFLVITTFEKETLEKYYFLLQNKTSAEFSSTKEIFSGRNLFNYCYALRQSRIFQITGKETWVRESSRIGYEINKDLLEREKNHTVEIGIRKKHILRIGNANITNLSSFNCMDHYGEFNWYVTTGFFPDSAFLFTRIPNLFNIISRETCGQERKREIIPKLIAIIDESAEIIPNTGQRLRNDDMFYNSVKKSIEELNGEEKFCKIPPILQFRLCSIATDALLDYRLNRTELNSLPDVPQTYRIRSSNFYIQPINPENACYFTDLTFFTNVVLQHEFLLCVLNIENVVKLSFLSLNLMNTSTAFVGLMTNLDQGIVNFKLFKTPLLQHIHEYSNIFSDEVI